MGVFSLAGWSRRIRAGFLVSRVTQDTATPRRTSRRGLSPAAAELSRTSRSSYAYDIAVLQPQRRIATPLVWALPRSLATTGGITFVFFSSRYSDVSVPSVGAIGLCRRRLSIRQPGCPIRKSRDQRSFAPTPGLSQLITSFIASMSQGIRHAPFTTFDFRPKGRTLILSALPRISIGHAGRSFLLLQSCLCQYVKDLFP